MGTRIQPGSAHITAATTPAEQSACQDAAPPLVQALAAQMAAVVADAEWLEPDERDAVQQLLRNEYTAEAPPPPTPPPRQQQQEQQQSQRQNASGLGASETPAAGSGPSGLQQQPKPEFETPAGPAAEQPPSEPQVSRLPDLADASEQQQRQEAVLAEAAEQLAAARQAAAQGIAETDAGSAPPGVPLETFRMLRWVATCFPRHRNVAQKREAGRRMSCAGVCVSRFAAKNTLANDSQCLTGLLTAAGRPASLMHCPGRRSLQASRTPLRALRGPHGHGRQEMVTASLYPGRMRRFAACTTCFQMPVAGMCLLQAPSHTTRHYQPICETYHAAWSLLQSGVKREHRCPLASRIKMP